MEIINEWKQDIKNKLKLIEERNFIMGRQELKDCSYYLGGRRSKCSFCGEMVKHQHKCKKK